MCLITTLSFKELNIHESLVNSLNQAGFMNPTEVQSRTIPEILDNKDIFAQAETGSGKTGSFAIPVLNKIVDNPEALYIVLSPTRELAQQTNKVFNDFGQALNVSTACLIGGESFDKQQKELDKDPNVLIATPGRICDFIKQKIVNISKCAGVIFDEADRLFEMGFQKDIEFILKNVPDQRQLIMVSATSNMEVLKTAYKFHSHPVEIKLNTDDLLVDNINHEVAMISEEEKMPYLVNLLRKHEDATTIIFCNTQYMTHLVSIWLSKMDFKVKAISGKMAQNRRTKLMEDFRSGVNSILVCTDVAARGLDIDDINLVVNYDLPNEAANYVHRIGRTGRAGKSGLAISFCGYKDCENLDAINEYIDGKIPKSDIEDEDFVKDIAPKPWIDAKTLKEKERTPRKNKYDKPKRNEKKEKMTKEKNYDKTPSEIKVKTFDVTSTSEKEARQKAIRYFKLQDESLLKSAILAKGSKKFFFFGPQKITYQFSVTPIFKRILLPFLIDLFKKMDLKVFVRVSFKDPEVRINISGKDIELFSKNKFELKRAVEQLISVQLKQKIYLNRNTKILIRLDKEDRVKKSNENLLALVEKTKSQILETNSSVLLKSLNPADRRIVHQAINDDSRFLSTSKGEGRFKQIEISLKEV